MITSGQKENAVNVIVAAARKAATEAIDELSSAGVLNSGNFQRSVLSQGGRVGVAVKVAVKEVLGKLAGTIVGPLKRLFIDRTIKIEATDGTEILEETKDVFDGGILDPGLHQGKATIKTIATVYQVIEEACYAKIFGSFVDNLADMGRLYWTDSQVVVFCRHHYDLFMYCGRTQETLFLLSARRVVFVGVDDDGCLYARNTTIDYNEQVSVKVQLRIVIPKQ